MAEPENIILEPLRLIRADIAKVDERITRVEERLRKVEHDLGGLMEIMVGMAGTLHLLDQRVSGLETK